MRARLCTLSLIGIVSLAGCDQLDVVLVPGLDGSIGDASIPPAPEGLLDLRVDPPSTSVLETGSPHATVAFRAIGSFEDGERDLTSEVAWRLARPSFGTIEGGLFTAASVGGTTQVEALVGSFSAAGELTVLLDVAHTEGVDPALPGMFPPDPTGERAGRLQVLYPASGVSIPANMPSMRLQWENLGAVRGYEVRMESSAGTVRFYSDAAELLPELSSWAALAESHLGRFFTMTVRAASSTTTEVFRSPPVTIAVQRGKVLGAAYYWSSRLRGIARAELGASASVRIFPAPGAPDEPSDNQDCSSCYSLSRDGRKLAVAWKDFGVQLLDLSSATATEWKLAGQSFDSGWLSFNPDGDKLAHAHDGRLQILDLVGQTILSAAELPSERWATHPDWSQDGDWVAVAYVHEDAPSDDEIGRESDIARISVDANGQLGAPDVVTEAREDEYVLQFPASSPDGRWIAYARGERESGAQKELELWLVRADGSGSPIRLSALNRTVGPLTNESDLENSMPSWVASDDGSTWLVFASRREYGRALERDRQDQLWGSRIDLDRAAAGQDPSAPAFWLPFQSTNADVGRAFWARP